MIKLYELKSPFFYLNKISLFIVKSTVKENKKKEYLI